jgi:hypothetical protein
VNVVFEEDTRCLLDMKRDIILRQNTKHKGWNTFCGGFLQLIILKMGEKTKEKEGISKYMIKYS